jgi:peptidoglycan-associated lipoprotein
MTSSGPDAPGNGAQNTTAAQDGIIGLDPSQRAALLREFQQTAGERVFFALDSYDLSSDARSTLDAQATWLRRQPQLRVMIAGHADERGTREYNLGLGARRAHAVRSYLINQGVAAERLETVSYGKERPLDPRSNEQGWARNRNAHSVLTELVGND